MSAVGVNIAPREEEEARERDVYGREQDKIAARIMRERAMSAKNSE